MAQQEDEPTEAPATWENVVVGKAKHLLGRATGDEDLTAEGEAQEEIAHEVAVEHEVAEHEHEHEHGHGGEQHRQPRHLER